MATEVKFCGLTRVEDAAEAVRLGASYLGVIFAGGPRQVTAATARAVHRAAPAHVGRVGVVGRVSTDEIVRMVEETGIDIVQLHGDPSAADVAALRSRMDGEIWAVLRAEGPQLPGVDEARQLFDAADAVVVDARVDGALGGTGVALPWRLMAKGIGAARSGRRARLVVAGGLRPENVGEAIAALGPDVVDVSSGVESAPGIKDHGLMRAFAMAARASSVR